jgi:hypothetical protein
MRLSTSVLGTLSILGFAAIAVSSPTLALQTDEAIIIVDVMVVNDDGGTNDGTTFRFVHPILGGGTETGTDTNTDVKDPDCREGAMHTSTGQ